MNLLSRIFGSQQNVQQPAVPANPMAPHSITSMQQPPMINPANPQIPNLPNPDPQLTQQQTQEEKPPLFEFNELWKIPDADPKNPQPDTGPVRFNVDATKVRQQVGKVDFTKAISPEIMAKINAGGPEAMAALLTAMNAVGQEVMINTSMANTKILEAGLEQSQNRITQGIPGLVRSQSISSALREDNPLFTNPATVPLMDALVSQFTQKFPNATPAEIKQHAQSYLLSFAQETQKVYKVDSSNQPLKPVGKTNVQDDWSQEPIV